MYFKLISYNFSPSNANSKGPIKQSLILLKDLVSCVFSGGIYKHCFCLKTGYVSSLWASNAMPFSRVCKIPVLPGLNVCGGGGGGGGLKKIRFCPG